MSSIHELINGPSKWELHLCLFHNEKPSDRPTAVFKMIHGSGETHIVARITKVWEINFESQTWGFEGALTCIGWLHSGLNVPCAGSYSTNTRKGSIDFDHPVEH